MAINGDDININKRPDMIVNLTNDDNYKFTKRIEEAYIADDEDDELGESVIINNPNNNPKAEKLRISGIGHKSYIKLETEQNGREK